MEGVQQLWQKYFGCSQQKNLCHNPQISNPLMINIIMLRNRRGKIIYLEKLFLPLCILYFCLWILYLYCEHTQCFLIREMPQPLALGGIVCEYPAGVRSRQEDLHRSADGSQALFCIYVLISTLKSCSLALAGPRLGSALLLPHGWSSGL